MNCKLVSGLIATAIMLVPAAAWAAHGKAGLWNISTTMQMANMPQIPPEAMAMMKSRGMSVPGMGGKPFTSQICMTQDQVTADRLPAMNHQEINCTPKVLNQSATSVTTEVTCHGTMEGVGRSQINWRGNEHYEGTYNFKGVMHGQAQDVSTHYVGDFVKADCGAVKPFMPKMAH